MSLLIVTLSRLEHTRAVRPSHLLQFFLLILLLCNAVRLRTLFLIDYPTSLVASASIHTFLTGLLLLLESLDKRELFYSQKLRDTLPPEETIGLFGKRFLWFLNSLFKEGYSKILKPQDLFSVDADLASKERHVRFNEVWSRRDKTKKAPLARTIWTVLWPDIISPVIPRCVKIGTTLSQPYLITAMIDFVQARDGDRNKGYGLIVAFALNYSLLAISSSWSAYNVARFSTKLRSSLISLIYEQTLRSPSKDVDLSSATVLMNVDVEKLIAGVRFIHEIWALMISAGVALYILYTHLGIAFVAPLIAVFACTGACAWIGNYMKARQLLWTAATQVRVTRIASAIGSMKGIRMLGLSETVLHKLTGLRVAEVGAQRGLRKLLIWVLLVSNTMFQMVSVLTYGTFTVIALTRNKNSGPNFDFNLLYGSQDNSF